MIYTLWICWLIMKLNKDLIKTKQHNQNESEIKISKNIFWKTTRGDIKLDKSLDKKNTKI